MDESREESLAPGRSAASLMPGGAVREVLKERARLLARAAGPEPTRRDNESFMAVRVEGIGCCGIPYRFIEELAVMPDITPVPCTPPVFAGIVNYRGELLSVLNLGAFFRRAGGSPGRNARIVVVRDGRLMAGLWVDDILGNDVFESGALAPFPAGPAGSPVGGVVMGVHAGQVAMLDIGVMLASPDLRFDEKMSP
ncbi:MAG TPA: chemotaxis protein CheW [Fluviicoccus sp.]|nr:chemotaxis protein CheW [Fluviicoccus sp.]